MLSRTYRVCAARSVRMRSMAVRSMATIPVAAGSFKRLIHFIDETNAERFGEAVVEGTQTATKATDFVDGKVYTVKKFLPPVVAPDVICIGLNYKDHAAEVKLSLPQLPVVFGRAASSLTGHNEQIHIPAVARDKPEVDFEGELAIIIGKPCKDVTRENAFEYILGYACANDVSARRWQGKKGGGQWYRCKSFDTFGPLGPYLVAKELIPDPNNLRIKTVVNGQTLQDSNTNQMVFSVPEIIEFCSQGTTLQPGTVILTGTPAGVGMGRNPPLYLESGDKVEVTIEGLGTLVNTVA